MTSFTGLNRLSPQDVQLLFALSPSELKKKILLISDHALKIPSSTPVTHLSSHALVKLPYRNNSYDLLLCLDLNEDQYNLPLFLDFQRVAHEIRVFPIAHQNGNLFPTIAQIMLEFQKRQFGIEIKHIPSVLNIPSNALLRAWSQTCPVNALP
ncbi:MAG: hypothetical protein HY939_00735 [Gammaproteobacteria bacterium]|nr:hypothetical protein [Gammaproteobacteria bacterium]